MQVVIDGQRHELHYITFPQKNYFSLQKLLSDLPNRVTVNRVTDLLMGSHCGQPVNWGRWLGLH